jgi:hypothetical protein
VFYKGKTDGETCVQALVQEDAANNCLYLEIYDFVKKSDYVGDSGVEGSRNKSISLFYEGQNTADPDPKNEAPRTLARVVTRTYFNNIEEEHKVVSNFYDLAPNGTASHNDKIELFYQEDGYPYLNAPENLSERGMGRYGMDMIENSRSNPIRNHFKRDFYLQNVEYFDKVFTNIYNMNDRYGNGNVYRSIEALRGSLNY